MQLWVGRKYDPHTASRGTGTIVMVRGHEIQVQQVSQGDLAIHFDLCKEIDVSI